MLENVQLRTTASPELCTRACAWAVRLFPGELLITHHAYNVCSVFLGISKEIKFGLHRNVVHIASNDHFLQYFWSSEFIFRTGLQTTGHRKACHAIRSSLESQHMAGDGLYRIHQTPALVLQELLRSLHLILEKQESPPTMRFSELSKNIEVLFQGMDGFWSTLHGYFKFNDFCEL